MSGPLSSAFRRSCSSCACEISLPRILFLSIRSRFALAIKQKRYDRMEDGYHISDGVVVPHIVELDKVDTRVPPLTKEELERLIVYRYGDSVRPEECKAVGLEGQTIPDAVYKSRGFLTPREVADLYAPYFPTFFVELRHALRALPASMKDPIMNPFHKSYFRPADFLRKYPMIFEIVTQRYAFAKVRLRETFVHPAKGTGDKALEQFSENYLSPEDQKDKKIKEILEKHLTAEFVPVVQWINRFPKEDLDFLNTEPPERVVTVLQRFPVCSK